MWIYIFEGHVEKDCLHLKIIQIIMNNKFRNFEKIGTYRNSSTAASHSTVVCFKCRDNSCFHNDRKSHLLG
jgi:hypothetical protein